MGSRSMSDVPWDMENANSGKPEGPEIRDKMEIVTLVFSLIPRMSIWLRQTIQVILYIQMDIRWNDMDYGYSWVIQKAR